MIDFLRSLFGLESASGSRKVVGTPDKIKPNSLPYIQDSNRRLKALLELSNRYKNTPHEKMIRAVYLKTKRIHFYLIGRNREHELELFHLKHTDHFLNTFQVILDVHQLQQEPAVSSDERSARRVISNPDKKVKNRNRQHRETSDEVYNQLLEAATYIPILSAPEISINTYSRLVYQEGAGIGAAKEIGYSSTAAEKETFALYVSDKLGIEGVSYLGNTLVKMPDGAPETAPVIRWNGTAYVLCLDDEQLYPVTTFAKQR